VIADHLSRTVVSHALGFSTSGHAYRLEISERHDGMHYVALLVLDPEEPRDGACIGHRPACGCATCGDALARVRRERWTSRHGVLVADLDTARTRARHIAINLERQLCVACDSPLILDEIRQHRGVHCYGCGEARMRGHHGR
jgi:hypothetical protein